MRWSLVVVAVLGCEGSAAAPVASAPGPRAVHRLRRTDRWPVLAAPIAFTADGQRWIGAVERALVEHEGPRARRRLHAGMTTGPLRPLPGDRWLAGTAVLDRDGALIWSADQWARRYGRFGGARALAVSPDGRVAIADGADAPSTCLCDRERGRAGSAAGELVRLTFGEGEPVERVLEAHADRREYRVAASATAIAAAAGRTLSVWPATGDGPPVTVTLDGPALDRLVWAGERYLVGTRYVDPDHADVLVLDRDAGYAPAWTWPVEGTVAALEVRPGGAELAIATTRYRATDRVLVDERRVAVVALDGTRRARVDTAGYPLALAWSPRGDALLVATGGNQAREQGVTRYAVE